MPQIKIKGIEKETVKAFSKSMVDDLSSIIDCPRDHLIIECQEVISIFDGEEIPVYPFIELAWFDRGTEVQDKVSDCIFKYLSDANIEEAELAFTTFKERNYYYNGKHF